jgi:hypothetical protein
MQITIFKTVWDVNTPFNININEVLNEIKNGKFKSVVDQVRNAPDKKTADSIKRGLPAICFSGTFRPRSVKGLIQHSGYACLDFDKFSSYDELIDFRKLILESEYTYACFISPSGNGLKVLVKIPPCNGADHKKYYLALSDSFDIQNIDKTTSDVCRVCYYSYDETLFVNEDSKVWDVKQEYEPMYYVDSTPKIQIKDNNKIISILTTWSNNRHPIIQGERNNHVFVLACALSEYGIDKFDAISHLRQYASNEFSEKEIEQTVNSAYKKTIAKFNSSYFNDNDTVDYIKRLSAKGHPKSTILKQLEHKGIDGETIDAIIDETNTETFWKKSDKGKVTIIHGKLKQWMYENGFSKYYPEHSENFVFIYKDSNLIDNTNENRIKDYVLNYLESLEDSSIYELMVEKTNYFKDSYLNFLDNTIINFKEDSKTTSYIYFNNGAIEITSKDIKLISYIDLDGFVWRKHIINKDFKKIDYSGCDFEKFVYNIAGKDQAKEKSIKSTIGYLLHSYKNSAQNYAVILNDEVISDNPNGGTGKGILINAISKLKRCAIIDGKTFSFDKSFPYQTVGVDTQMIVFDDVIRNFPFEKLFSIVTEGITIEKKNKDAIKIPVESSPKIIISTNYAIGGEGSSFERRKWEIELAQHYTLKNTPLQEFGHLLFDQWSEDEWMKFYNYMINCLQLYLAEGLVKVEFTNAKLRKFIATTNANFKDWSDELPFQLNVRVDKKAMYEKFVSEYPDNKKIHQRTFTKWIKSFAIYKDWDFSDGTTHGFQWFLISDGGDEEIINDLKLDEDAPF